MTKSADTTVIYLASFADPQQSEAVAHAIYHLYSSPDRRVVRLQAISLQEEPSSLRMTRSVPFEGTTLRHMRDDSHSARLEAVTSLRMLSAMTSADVVLCTTPGLQTDTDPAVAGMYADLAADFQANTLVIVPADGLDRQRLEASIHARVAYVRRSGAHVIGVITVGSPAPHETPSGASNDLSEGAQNRTEGMSSLDELAVLPLPDDGKLTDRQQRFLLSLLSRRNPTVVTPSTFQFGLLDRARAKQKTIVLPEGNEERILAAANYLLEQHVVRIMLCGDPSQIRAQAEQLGFHAVAEQATLQGFDDEQLLERMASKIVELRKDSRTPVTLDQARELARQPSYFGTMCVELGLADGMVSGAVHSTADTVRPALQIIRPRADHRIVSGAMIMCLDHRVDLYADVALLPNPTAMQLAEIAQESAATARLFGLNPVVGMLSYSTGQSGKGPDVDLVRNATQIVRTSNPDLPVTGPIQFDAAWSPKVARIKAPDDPAAGHVSVFVLPDLSSSNVAVKAVQRVGHAVAIGPILQGLNRPINDLSRGASVRDIINTIAVTAIEA